MTSKTVIEINHIRHQYGKYIALQNIDFTIKQGEIIGFLGPSGSGKTTLVKTIVGMNTPKEGCIKINGVTMPSLEAVKHIGYMAQADALYDDLSGMDNLIFFAKLYGLKTKKAKQRAQEVLKLVELQNDAKKLVKNYSGGMKRRLSLCIALIHEPDILILDEPTVGIDPVLRRIFWKEFKRLQTNGITIIITTHTMDEAQYCDRLAFIYNGSLTAIGDPEELKKASGKNSIEGAFLFYGSGKDN
jgi:ABC-2 type transport system ATP-binding protein